MMEGKIAVLGKTDFVMPFSSLGLDIFTVEEESEKIKRKLANDAFRQKAPPEVIAKNEAQYAELAAKKEKLMVSKEVLEDLSR